MHGVNMVYFVLWCVWQAQEKLGPVDMLVNCAGMSISGKFEEVEVDRFRVSVDEQWACVGVCAGDMQEAPLEVIWSDVAYRVIEWLGFS